jgi:radical SAM protein with 4Fe4S-binding SPASM domain
MNCDYCFAVKPGFTDEMAKAEPTIDFLKSFLNSDFFLEGYEQLCINLWGGEPTMKMSHIEKFCNTFKNNPSVRLFIFTNGYRDWDMERLKRLLLVFKEMIGNEPKLCIQISYDGMPIHDIKRKSNRKKLTSGTVKKMIKWCDKNQIPFVIKSTVTPDTFKYMHDAYKDIYNLYKECRNTGFYKNLNYFPTIDYYASEKANTAQHTQYCKDLEQSLSAIASNEMETKSLERGHFFFAWFNRNRSKCTAGKHSFAIDIDGKIYACHGCLYSQDKKLHYITSIYEPKWKNELKRDDFQLAPYMNWLAHHDCTDCDVEYCLKCNHGKFSHSKKHGYLEKWFDFKCQPQLCEYYKINNIVKQAMYKVGGLKNGMQRTL